jgi:site-specific recombinase XerD
MIAVPITGGGSIMHDKLFNLSATVARYRCGPHAEARERFLRRALANGYSPATVASFAWALPIIADAAEREGGSFSYQRLKRVVLPRIRLKTTKRPPSANTAKLLLRCGKAWLRSIGTLTPEPERPIKFAAELRTYTEYMSVEQGLSPTTIASREERMRWFCGSLPSRVRSLRAVTLVHVDAFLEAQALRGWSRKSLHALGSSLRSFFRYAAYQGWCRPDLASAIELPHLYALEDVPRAPSAEAVSRLLEDTASNDDPVSIRDHAILLLLVHYGLRRGEVERLTLDDLDWMAETIHVTRPKQRRAQCYPMSATLGDAILRYLRHARPRCSHRNLFLTIQAPFRALSGSSITYMVRMRLTKQGVQLNRRGAHCLRHACASQLLDAGFTLKQIADHLGHRSLETTRIYTKLDLHSLRQVAEVDLGALL